MRPPSNKQSWLRCPLNRLLGTEANVRILRVLTATTTPLGKAEIARRAELNASGVRRAIARLIDLEILEAVGSGGRGLIRLRRDHPVAPWLVALFTAERNRFESVIEDLRGVVARLRPPPQAAWLEGPVARETDAPGDPIVLAVLLRAEEAEPARERAHRLVSPLMNRHGVLVELRVYTLADLAAMSPETRARLEQIITLLGPPPLALLDRPEAPERSETAARTHTDRDRRSLALGQAIAERLTRDPSLIEHAHRYIERRLSRASPGESRDLREWRRLLENLSPAQIRRLLVDPGEEATRLRQTLPFLDALSVEERDRILVEAGE